MKKIVLILSLSAVVFASSIYVKSDENILQLKDAKVYFGTPGVVIKDGDKSKIVKFEGYFDNANPNTLYATKNFKLPLLESVNLKKDGEKASIELEILNSNLTSDWQIAWEDSGDVFYDKCTKCHGTHAPKEFDMLSWEGLYISMKDRAQPTDNQEMQILRYLYAHANDGILEER
ncbi:hypothetical protein Q4Y15_000783 [Campylobacter fetus]|uniref:Molybdopterin-containing oxidoreductase I, DMSO/TMAO/BSO reductase family, monoheme c-type cytochrome n=2 Tax=Campylobacter fetus TaxID=196 RepID=A0AAE6IY14_CAMFE|nr:hypothetical protein [Campylobacter fetus]OCS23125.1 hypothetical protein CFVI97532_02435 [Campylobacter fetus subsp. venerealis cfvi97/532]OCS27320.1 hypothetical protein CFVB10_01185 [Campylobacter fetus subsp. venerealis cfvB10]OCS30425.1 hypothetical protein CFVCCUG33900_02730 [Campylobacter fetus subsp. venerealis LMG 6570 = CCUG 33900]OCS43242.1 hypothetical protein CFVI02298_00490 [Campylobacter fetus subsp. venerealis cfvi02/298]AHE93771.1 molybdopterin-containing oxidoreductase I, 